MSNHTTSIDNSHFNKWTPLIGDYIAGATIVSVIAVVIDLMEGLRRKQYWIPSRWSSLNAVSITVITAASKLSLDLSTSMPRQIDQLSKLSTSTFVCIALAHVIPSIGKLENSEFLANIAALSVFAISSIVGLCIQLRTRVIFTFQAAHIALIVTMSILLFKCVVSITTLSFTKSYFKVKYDTQHEKALKDVKDTKPPTTKKLKQYLERFSMMAHSGCPYFNISRSVATAIYPLCGGVAALAFFTILIACISHKDKFLGPTSHTGTSSYGWSVLYILISQTIGIGVGAIVLCIRGYHIIVVQSRKVGLTSSREQNIAAPKKYWMEFSEWTKWFPLLPYIEYRQQKGLGRLLQYPFYMACLIVQNILIIIDFILFRCILYLSWICILSVIPARARPHRDEVDSMLKELKPYFLSSIMPFNRVEVMMKSFLSISKKCLDGEERETKHLTALLRDYCSDDFEGAVRFQIPTSPKSQEPPPHSWSLSVLTLTWIATALPNVDPNTKEKLRKSVMEGLVYVKLIEDNFNNKHHFANVRASASCLWLGLDVTCVVRFCCLGWVPKLISDKTARGTLEAIRDYARFVLLHERFDPYQLVGAHYMYGTCEMILRDCENDPDASLVIFDNLRRSISDILGACLINLKTYILLKCEQSSSIEKRREDACRILSLFGETKEILEILEAKHIPDILPEEMVHLDSWCQSHHHHHLEEEAGSWCRFGCNIL